MDRKYAVILGNLGNTCDRFLSSGYKSICSKKELWDQAANIKGVSGIELVGNWDITTDNIKEVKEQLDKYNLTCVSIIPDLFSQKKWGNGSFTSRDKNIRQQAVDETCRMIDVASELGCSLINIWPGQDGYDYCFQGDFINARLMLIEGIRKCAQYNPEIKLSLEYKEKEPRTHSYLARAADTLLIAQETGCDNVGVTVDVGHSLMASENMAESAVLLLQHKKLFHLHFNDNYRSWDDDMIVGSVHLVEYLELFYWLNVLDYQGWYSIDQYPYRENAQGAINESIRWIDGLLDKLGTFGWEKFDALIKTGNAIDSSALIRKFLGIN